MNGRKPNLLFLVSSLFLSGCIQNVSILPDTIPPGQEVAATNHIENGKKHLRKGKCKQAIHQFEKAVEKDPGNVYGNYWLGASHYGCGNYHTARNYWYISLDLRSGNSTWLSRIRTVIGFTFELEGDRNKAYSEYTFALNLDPSNSVAKIGIGGSESSVKVGKGKGKSKGKGKAKKRSSSSSFRSEVEALIFLGL